MFRFFKKASLVCLAVTALGCDPQPSTDSEVLPQAPGEVAASTKQRITSSAPSADLRAAVQGQNGLALNLLRETPKDAKGNLFLSPYSIATALSMTSAGAQGDTLTAFENVLGSGLSNSAHHRAMNDLDAQLTSRGSGALAADGQPFRLKTANQLFSQNGFPVEVPFLDTLAQEYGANVRLLDFEKGAEPSRVAINKWVEQKTEDRIKDLLPSGSITSATRLVLVNALYFNAAWKEQFKEENTSDRAFNVLSGTPKTVPMMRGELNVRAATVNGVEVVEMPYDGEEMSMWVMMPPAGAYESFEQSLNANLVSQFGDALKSERVELLLPRFETTVRSSLKDPLTRLGLGRAFDPQLADLSAINKDTQLFVADVVHQAFVKVNEKGTEAAAATGVIVGVTSTPLTPRTVEINRPFVFAVRDNATGALVFIGRMVDPS